MLTSCLLLYTQHPSQLPCEISGSSHSVLEEAESMLCRAVQLLLSFRCMCLFFFSFNSSVKLFSSAQHLSNSFPFSIFPQEFPAYVAKKSIFLDSLFSVLVSTACSICCRAMQRGRWAALVCPEAQRVCVRVCKLMSCVPGFCSRSTKVLSELQPPVR